MHTLSFFPSHSSIAYFLHHQPPSITTTSTYPSIHPSSFKQSRAKHFTLDKLTPHTHTQTQNKINIDSQSLKTSKVPQHRKIVNWKCQIQINIYKQLIQSWKPYKLNLRKESCVETSLKGASRDHSLIKLSFLLVFSTLSLMAKLNWYACILAEMQTLA